MTTIQQFSQNIQEKNNCDWTKYSCMVTDKHLNLLYKLCMLHTHAQLKPKC